MWLLTLIPLALTIVVTGYRLPDSIIPESYKLEIITVFGEEDPFEFSGNVRINVLCVKTTNNITLHSKDLDVLEDDVYMKDLTNPGQVIDTIKIIYTVDKDFLILKPNIALTENHRYEIYIPYEGTLEDGLDGFYRSSYIDDETGEKRWLGVTQFEAISARKAFPCFDEPKMKATFEISIARKKGYNAISNMPLRLTEPFEKKPGWFWDHFNVSVPMSTYLVAWMVSDFDYREGTEDNSNVTFRVWSRNDLLKQVEFAKGVGRQALKFFEKYFNIRYPLPKQDMAAIPDFNMGAMENWGLITYRESSLLVDLDVSSMGSQYGVANTVAHELAHQWFGNLVTMIWWTDLWLNEGFATYMASLAVDNLFPQWNTLQDDTSSNMLRVFNFDSLRTSHPVSLEIGDPNEINEIFDTISYKKGSSLLRMMNMFLGKETFKTGVTNYLNKYSYRNAEQDDLWNSLSEVAHEKGTLPKKLALKTVMDTWTLQTGYPVIHVSRNYASGKIRITRERFLKDIYKLPTDPNPCWWVPLSFSTSSKPDFHRTIPKVWLGCPGGKVYSLKNMVHEHDWIIFNNQMAGLYRVNYDKKNWQMITEALQKDNHTIPTLNRVQLIADAADLAFTGNLNYEIFFKLLGYLNKETQYLPWKVALQKAGVLLVYLRRNPVFGIFKDYMRNLLVPMYEKMGGLGVLKKENEDKLEQVLFQHRIASGSCLYGVDTCVRDAIDLFQKWQAAPNGSNPIPKDIALVVYITALKYGGEKEWDFLWQKYQKTRVATEKNDFLVALGATREIWLLNRYLDWTLDDNRIRKQDCSTAFSAVSRNEIGFYIAKRFFFKNIKKIFKHLKSPRAIVKYLTVIAEDLTDGNHLERLQNFLENNKNIFVGSKKTAEQALETAKLNVQWQQARVQEVEALLLEYNQEDF